MNILIAKYIEKLSIDDVNNFAINNKVYLSNDELAFTYNFVKNNWKNVLSNPSSFDVNKYAKYYNQDNFEKIKKLIEEYSIKYAKYI